MQKTCYGTAASRLHAKSVTLKSAGAPLPLLYTKAAGKPPALPPRAFACHTSLQNAITPPAHMAKAGWYAFTRFSRLPCLPLPYRRQALRVAKLASAILAGQAKPRPLKSSGVSGECRKMK
ncbi:hypothetical protein NPIL_510131 [Nephila pilipes]|uniref:Uncharacterized protein n=1 Tax=Nephila pilipes TaxID=299642 RepID=A0A8X6PNA8_NEPPI|nr:hypothetical protein NPIL_510131 [Nephila pilipes]